jgi:hypothetical protein
VAFVLFNLGGKHLHCNNAASGSLFFFLFRFHSRRIHTHIVGDLPSGCERKKTEELLPNLLRGTTLWCILGGAMMGWWRAKLLKMQYGTKGRIDGLVL